MTRAVRTLRAALTIAVVLVALLGLLQTTPTASAAADSLTVNRDEAKSDFPNGIELRFDVEAGRKITRIELLYQTADLETLSLSVPDFKPGKHVEFTHLLDFRLNYQPSGVDITYRWRVTDDRDTVVETDPKTLLWGDNRFEWQTISSPNVTVYAYNQNEAFNRIILDSAQSTVDRLAEEFGVTVVTPIRIWVYNAQRDFAATQQGNSSHWIAGTAYPQLHVILAILPEGNKREVGRVIPHEISHQVLNQLTKNPFNAPPTWLDEGLAVLNQDNGNEDFLAMVDDAADKGRLFSIRALNSSFPFDAADAALAYAESYAIVRFIIDHFGEDKLAAIFNAYPDGVSHDEAVMRGLGIDINELDQLWKESLNYPGDTPRGAGSTRTASPWDDVAGIGLAAGAIALVSALMVAAGFVVSANRKTRRSISRCV